MYAGIPGRGAGSQETSALDPLGATEYGSSPPPRPGSLGCELGNSCSSRPVNFADAVRHWPPSHLPSPDQAEEENLGTQAGTSSGPRYDTKNLTAPADR